MNSPKYFQVTNRYTQFLLKHCTLLDLKVEAQLRELVDLNTRIVTVSQQKLAERIGSKWNRNGVRASLQKLEDMGIIVSKKLYRGQTQFAYKSYIFLALKYNGWLDVK